MTKIKDMTFEEFKAQYKTDTLVIWVAILSLTLLVAVGNFFFW